MVVHRNASYKDYLIVMDNLLLVNIMQHGMHVEMDMLNIHSNVMMQILIMLMDVIKIV